MNIPYINLSALSPGWDYRFAPPTPHLNRCHQIHIIILKSHPKPCTKNIELIQKRSQHTQRYRVVESHCFHIFFLDTFAPSPLPLASLVADNNQASYIMQPISFKIHAKNISRLCKIQYMHIV